MQRAILVVISFICISVSGFWNADYGWLKSYSSHHTIDNRYPPPFPYVRTPVKPESIQEWLRNFPLKDYNTKVKLANGQVSSTTHLSAAVLDLDLGPDGNQHAVDLPVRLWSEYLYCRKRYWAIEFNLYNGERIDFNLWATGLRATPRPDKVKLYDSEKKNYSYDSFREYMDVFFKCRKEKLMFREFRKLGKHEEPQIGDFVYSGDYQGHALVIMDKAIHRSTLERIYLLAQGNTPPRDFHIIRNLRDKEIKPWYRLAEIMYTPLCVLDGTQVYRPFPETRYYITRPRDEKKDFENQAAKILFNHSSAATFIIKSFLFPDQDQ